MPSTGLRRAAAGAAALGVASALVFRSLPSRLPVVHAEAASSAPQAADRIAGWTEKWNGKVQGWHLPQPHTMLLKYSDVLLQQPTAPAGSPARAAQPRKVLFPLCGADTSLGHLARQGHAVMGVDGVARALDQLMGEYGQELPARHAATPSGTLVVRTAQPPASAGHQTRGKAKGEIGPQAPDEPALPAQDETDLSVQAVPGPAAPL
eukprot:scaffold47957_cov185-Isochrysis_galbana.AAC.1